MTQKTKSRIKELIEEDKDLIRELMQIAIQEVLEAEMVDALGAEKGERTEDRL